MKRILITGSKGFIGSYFINKYKNKYEIKNFSFLKDDINSLDSESIDIVFHLSALVHQMGGVGAEEYEKVNVIYNMMNFIGFYSDTKLDQVNGVQRSMSDFTHAQIASFCHFFFTNDKNLIKKVDAIYEYLDIPTRLARIEINSD